MEFYEVVERRRCIRAYADRPVPADVLERILNAARLAPSARNLQPWKFVVVADPQRRRQLAEASRGQTFVGTAPVVIAGVATEPDHVMSCDVPAYPVNLGIAMEHIALAATAEGLGVCWIGAFEQDKVREILGVPEQYKVVQLMPLGFPAGQLPAGRPRKALADIVSYEQF